MPLVPSVRAAVGDVVSRWAVESQHGARRNAMVASTAIAAQRREQADVEDFLAARGPAGDREDVASREAQGGL